MIRTVELRRPLRGHYLPDIPVAVECFDYAKASPEAIAAMCTEADSIRKAAMTCDMAHRRGADCPPVDDAVYLIAPKGAEVCKIGMARNPAKRLSGIQTANWEDLELRGLFWSVDGRASALESAALRAAKQAGFGMRGEWFQASPAFLAVLVSACASEIGLKIADSGMWLRQRLDIRKKLLAIENDWELTPSLFVVADGRQSA